MSAKGSRRHQQFQEKWKPVFRPELRKNKQLERIADPVKFHENGHPL
jgi:hypothetical protein